MNQILKTLSVLVSLETVDPFKMGIIGVLVIVSFRILGVGIPVYSVSSSFRSVSYVGGLVGIN